MLYSPLSTPNILYHHLRLPYSHQSFHQTSPHQWAQARKLLNENMLPDSILFRQALPLTLYS
jgi:hypothetical protein